MTCCSKSGIQKHATKKPHSRPNNTWEGRERVRRRKWGGSFSFWTSRVVWFPGYIGFLRSAFTSNGSLQDFLFLKTLSFRFGKIHISWLLYCSDKLLRWRCPITRQNMHLAVAFELDCASGFEFVLILLSRFACIPRLFDAIGLFANEELVGTWEDKFVAVDFGFATLLFPLVPASFSHRCGAAYQAEILSATSRTEMADVEQMKQIVPFVTCEITFGKNVCELMFGINVWNLNSGIKINPVKQQIQRNSVGCWHTSHCGTSAFFDYHPFITASLSSKTNNRALEPERVPLDGTWSKLVRSRLVFCFRMFDWLFAVKFHRGSLSSLVLLVWFGVEWLP